MKIVAHILCNTILSAVSCFRWCLPYLTAQSQERSLYGPHTGTPPKSGKLRRHFLVDLMDPTTATKTESRYIMQMFMAHNFQLRMTF